MNKPNKFILVFGMLFYGFPLMAQFESDHIEKLALFSSRVNYGSARTNGFSNAGIARLDLAELSLFNPASIAGYSRNELTLSIGFNNYWGQSQYNFSETSYSTSSPNLNSATVVFNFPSEQGGKDVNFAVSVNKLADFKNEISFQGTNLNSGFSDWFIQNSQGVNALSLDGNYSLLGLGWENFLLDVDPNQCSSYDCEHYRRLFAFSALSQGGTRRSDGNQYQWDFLLGSDFGRVSGGLKLGFASIKYSEEIQVNESEIIQRGGNYSGSTLTSKREYNGRGPNFGLGINYELNENLNFGFSFSSPTWYSLKEVRSDQLNSSFNELIWMNPFQPLIRDTLSNFSNATVNREQDLKFTDPLRLGFGILWAPGDFGRFSVDLEYSPTGSANMNFERNADNAEWEFQKEGLSSSFWIRAGYEYAIGDNMVKLGFARFPEIGPEEQTVPSRNSYSIGFGRSKDLFDLDLAIRYQRAESTREIYSLDPGQGPKVNFTNNSLSIFLGAAIRF